MRDGWVRTWERGMDYVDSRGGVPWWKGAPPSRWHRCDPQTQGFIDGRLIERCRCGAARVDGYGPWINRNETRRNKA